MHVLTEAGSSIPSAHVLPDQRGVLFRAWSPHRDRVEVEVDGTLHALAREERGMWSTTVEGAGNGSRYWYLLDGERWADPASRFQPEGNDGPSQVVDSAFEWSGRALSFEAPSMADSIIYEMHVGTFTREGTLDAAIAHLPSLRDLGITTVELLPVAAFPGRRGWGYDTGRFLNAVHEVYGGPLALKRFVDAAHSLGLAVCHDVVYNHVCIPGSENLTAFGPFLSTTYTTPWGPTFNFDGSDSDVVREFVIASALQWIDEFRIDMLRLDATHAIIDTGAVHLLEELSERNAQLERPALLVTESHQHDPRLLRPRQQHGFGLDGDWNVDFHHALHPVLTGEVDGHYADYGSIGHLAGTLEHGWLWDRTYSAHRRRRHGRRDQPVKPSQLVVYAQNHDEIGNRAWGERFSTILSEQQVRTAALLMLTSPFVPLMFMGEEYGETNPFMYFIDHDDAFADVVRNGRKADFADFRGFHGALPDPQDPEIFERSRIDLSRREAEGHRQLLEWHRTLLALRRSTPELGASEHGATGVDYDDDARWLRYHRGDGRFVVVANFGDAAVEVPTGAPAGSVLSVVVASHPDQSAQTVDGTVSVPAHASAVFEVSAGS